MKDTKGEIIIMDRKMILNQITTLDARIEKLRKTSNKYYQEHGVYHTGMATLIVALMDEKSTYQKMLKMQYI